MCTTGTPGSAEPRAERDWDLLGKLNAELPLRPTPQVHLVARGPGIPAGHSWAEPATQVDLAPTWLGMAGLAKPSTYDGKSLLPLLVPTAGLAPGAPAGSGPALPSATAAHLEQLGDSAAYAAGWRDAVFIEYYFVDDNDKCSGAPPPAKGYPLADSECGDLTPGDNAHCWGAVTKPPGICYPTEDYANNFIALRSMPGSVFGDTLYAEYV